VGSPTGGGLVWFLRDVVFGAGWGVVDVGGRPKSVWHALRRAFRPVQVLLVDEGLNGLDVHLINERPTRCDALLSLACLREGSVPVMRAERQVTLAPRACLVIPATDLWGGFFDTTYAYRFGPPSHDATVAVLSDAADGDRIAEAFHFPLGRGSRQDALGLEAQLEQAGEEWRLRLSSRRLAQSVHIADTHFQPEDNWFHLEPGQPRAIRLFASTGRSAPPQGMVAAINGFDRVTYGAGS
jgi:beta-mannosidase